MSWSDRAPRAGTPRRSIVLALAACAGLAACAFQPLYGPQGAGSKLNGRIAIAEPTTSRDYVMARELELAFGPAADPAYRLGYRLSVRSEDAAITSGQEIDRVNLIGTLRYTLRTLPGGETVATGTSDGFVSYSSAGEPVAINAARNDAELRLARILADRTFIFVLSNPAVVAASGAAE